MKEKGNRLKRNTVFFLFIIQCSILVGSLLSQTIPYSKNIVELYSIKEGIEQIDKKDYFALKNELLPNEMALNFHEKEVNKFTHTFIDTLNPCIMFSYLPYSIDDTEVQCRVANERFFRLYSPTIHEGRSFKSNDFFYKDTIPIVIGYNLQHRYKLGECYTFYHGDHGKSFQGEIIGILSKDSVYASLGEIKESLDDSYIIPLSDYFIDCFFGLSDYDLVISSAIVKSENEKMENFVKKANEIKFWELTPVPVSEIIIEYKHLFIAPFIQKYIIIVTVNLLLMGLILAETIAWIIGRHRKICVSGKIVGD